MVLEKIRIYESLTSTVDWLPEKKIILFTQFGRNEGQSLREGLNKGLDYLVQNKATKWLSDNRLLQSMRGSEDSNWLEEDWLPRARKAGWKYWALIHPRSVLTNLVYDRISNMFESAGVQVKIFYELEKACEWLEVQLD